jgi:hypothetical protein
MDVTGRNRKLVLGLTSLTLAVVVLLLRCVTTQGFDPLPRVFASNGPNGNYTTNFPSTENPISEGGAWINGRLAGLDWSNIRTSAGLAYGTQDGVSGYNDSIAALTGTWGQNQTVQATVHLKLPTPSSPPYEEVELWLRSTISAHSATGYEVSFQASTAPNAYVFVGRWNGAKGNYACLGPTGPVTCGGLNDGRNGPGLHDGDKIKASITGRTITVYVCPAPSFACSLIYTAMDNIDITGNPGMGFYLGGSGVNADYGFSSFSATDGSTSQTVSAPTGLSATVH